jgi:hypothetical protein
MGLSATCEDTPKKKRARKKAINEFDEDDHYDAPSDANGSKAKSHSHLMGPPPAKRAKRAAGNATKKKMSQLISEMDPVQSSLLPPGTLPSLNTTPSLSHGMNPGTNPYGIPGFDTSTYLDSLALSRQFPYATPPGYGAHAGYGPSPDATHPGMSTGFPGLSQSYPFYPHQYSMPSPYGHPQHSHASNLSAAAAAAQANLSPHQLPAAPSSAPSGPPALHSMQPPPGALSATTTASSSSSAQQQSSSSYSTNIRASMLPSPPRYMPNPMASLPSFPYNHMYNPTPGWMNYSGAPSPHSGANLALPSPSSLSSPHNLAAPISMSQPLPLLHPGNNMPASTGPSPSSSSAGVKAGD